MSKNQIMIRRFNAKDEKTISYFQKMSFVAISVAVTMMGLVFTFMTS